MNAHKVKHKDELKAHQPHTLVYWNYVIWKDVNLF